MLRSQHSLFSIYGRAWNNFTIESNHWSLKFTIAYPLLPMRHFIFLSKKNENIEPLKWNICMSPFTLLLEMVLNNNDFKSWYIESSIGAPLKNWKLWVVASIISKRLVVNHAKNILRDIQVHLEREWITLWCVSYSSEWGASCKRCVVEWLQVHHH